LPKLTLTCGSNKRRIKEKKKVETRSSEMGKSGSRFRMVAGGRSSEEWGKNRLLPSKEEEDINLRWRKGPCSSGAKKKKRKGFSTSNRAKRRGEKRVRRERKAHLRKRLRRGHKKGAQNRGACRRVSFGRINEMSEDGQRVIPIRKRELESDSRENLAKSPSRSKCY